MDIKTKPDTTPIEVMDYDFVFVGGVQESITLRPNDRVTLTNDGIGFHIESPEEDISIYYRHLLALRTRKRTIQVKKPVDG